MAKCEHSFLPQIGKGHRQCTKCGTFEKKEKAMTKKTKKAAPERHVADPEGMNQDRAEWARAAVDAFRAETGLDDGDGMDTAIGDLLADLAHLCDVEGLDFANLLARADDHYTAETSTEGSEDAEEIDGTWSVFVGADMEGDACLYITAEGEYLSEKQLDALAPAIAELLNAGTLTVIEDEEEDDEDEGGGDDLCDLCMSSGVNVERTTWCGKTIGIECGCEESNAHGYCGDAECTACKKAKEKE